MMQASAGCAASSCKSLWLTGSSLPCEAVPLWTTLDLRRAAEGWSEHIADHPNFYATSRERSSRSCLLKGAEAHSYRMLSRGLRTACVEHRTSTGERPQ